MPNPIVGLILLLMVVVGFFLMARLFASLRERHPHVFEQLGKPSLIMNNSLENNLRTWRFLLRRDYRNLDDSRLRRETDFLLVFMAIYFILFVVFVLRQVG